MDVLRASWLTWFKPKPPKKIRKEINSVVGSINASQLLEEKEKLEAEAANVMREKQMAVEARVAAFELCIGGCGCKPATRTHVSELGLSSVHHVTRSRRVCA